MNPSSPFEAIHPVLAGALTARGFTALTSVQEAVLSPELEGEDLLVSAQTGSGKTVAFGLALAPTLLDGAERLPFAQAPLALVIAPTRELALQVRGELTWLFGPAGGRIASCVGGMDIRDERSALAHGAHIVVGTPGRVVDHIRRGTLALDALQAVVLDEADEMMNLGFREELEYILDAAPAERRTLMFSATMPRAIEALAKRYQRDAQRVNTVNAQRQHADIEYQALVVAAPEVESAIFNVLRFYDSTNAIVFCATRAAVTRLASRFGNRGLSVVALSGELSQTERSRALQSMRDHRAQVCVATDVAARGIDLPDLDLVIHADLPKSTEALLHRSGRTGRAGRKGASVLIVPYQARRRTERLLQAAAVNARWGEPPGADAIKEKDDARLLTDPALHVPPTDAEASIVQALLRTHDPVNIAAAFVRLVRKGQASPEDLARAPDWSDGKDRKGRDRPERDRSERERPERERTSRRDNFVGGAWVSLSVGRTQSAEPRWLIPMLCKAGGLTKRQLGAIHIHDRETQVEIDADHIDEFFERIGDGGRLEKSIHVRRLDGPPMVEARTRREAPAHRNAPSDNYQRHEERARPGVRSDDPWADDRSSADHRPPGRVSHGDWQAQAAARAAPAMPAQKPRKPGAKPFAKPHRKAGVPGAALNKRKGAPKGKRGE